MRKFFRSLLPEQPSVGAGGGARLIYVWGNAPSQQHLGQACGRRTQVVHLHNTIQLRGMPQSLSPNALPAVSPHVPDARHVKSMLLRRACVWCAPALGLAAHRTEAAKGLA